MFFRRSESNRERALLRLVEQLQRKNDELLDRLMLMTGTPWNVPPADVQPRREEAEYVPPDWTATPEQEPIY